MLIKVLVNGACGRMGRAVVEAVSADDELELVSLVDPLGGEVSGHKVETDLAAAIHKSNPEIMVDFTRPAVVFANARTALTHKVAPVIGTTGLTAEQQKELGELATKENVPVFIAPNFAIGAVLMMKFSEQAAKYLSDVEIIELHHDKKLDAPSGTALRTAAMIAAVRKAKQQGHPEEKENLAGVRGGNYEGMHIHSVRLPGFVAHQEVIFGSLGETLTIRHDSTNRESFMPGVVLACKKILSQKGVVVGLEKILD